MSVETTEVGQAIREYVKTTKRPIHGRIPSRLSKEIDATEEEIEDGLEWCIEQGLLWVGEFDGETVVKVA